MTDFLEPLVAENQNRRAAYVTDLVERIEPTYEDGDFRALTTFIVDAALTDDVETLCSASDAIRNRFHPTLGYSEETKTALSVCLLFISNTLMRVIPEVSPAEATYLQLIGFGRYTKTIPNEGNLVWAEEELSLLEKNLAFHTWQQTSVTMEATPKGHARLSLDRLAGIEPEARNWSQK